MRTITLRCTLGKSLHKVQNYLEQSLSIIILVLLAKPLLSNTSASIFTAEPGLISFKGIAHPAVIGKEKVREKEGKPQEQKLRSKESKKQNKMLFCTHSHRLASHTFILNNRNGDLSTGNNKDLSKTAFCFATLQCPVAYIKKIINI